jgi:hypothetical protein
MERDRAEAQGSARDCSAATRDASDPLQQLVLLVPETPRSPTELSLDVVVALLVEGVKECEVQRTEALNRELAAVDRIGVDFFGSLAMDGTLEHLSAEFARTCPICSSCSRTWRLDHIRVTIRFAHQRSKWNGCSS